MQFTMALLQPVLLLFTIFINLHVVVVAGAAYPKWNDLPDCAVSVCLTERDRFLHSVFLDIRLTPSLQQACFKYGITNAIVDFKPFSFGCEANQPQLWGLINVCMKS